MRILLKILNYFFTVLGVIFFLIIMLGVYLFVADPFNLRPMLSSFNLSPSGITTEASKTGDKNPLLNSDQEKMLESIGVNPETLPSELTPEMEKCLIEKVGAQRADEIVKGDKPTAIDLFKASACLK
ncbi:MAG: hypothetical protein A2206_00370 [Candidatus Magasanikbacteria bacterium RIFOXYA1_FULL_40_8]|uniref:Uncharacterized protein n=1 Tax=Candidatus Magasanikbacteria bacterium RIFOXYA1_FULL_40_8 TaxID=1798694 RepID=A0A1F6NSV8_9BACT|nr:MAG: hypothetical protein A2206_00370 [Candidatus Magasanikbacteria bacterium RIFOXYA1_FULL_40_8]